MFGLATVILWVNQPPQITVCPPVAPSIVKNEDGSYTRPAVITVPSISCWTNAQAWLEEWTDYPENGGTFIKRLEPRKDAP